MKNEKRKVKKKDSSRFTVHGSQEEQSERLDDKRPVASGREQELEDLLKRVQAEYINYRKRTEEERVNLLKSASKSTILKILPVLDNLDRALKHTPKELDENDWVKGLIHIKSQMENILKEEGLEIIETKGRDFDHNLHEAISFASGEGKDGEVIEEYEKGYMLNGQVIRPAKVVVGKNK